MARAMPEETRNFRFAIGDRIGRYRLLQRPGTPASQKDVQPLGDGGTSVVFLVEQELAGDKKIYRALKLFSPTEEIKEKQKKVKDTSGRHNFLEEIDAISSVTHQNIVKIVDAGHHKSEDFPYFVMEYVEGDTLQTLLDQGMTTSWAAKAQNEPFIVVRIAQQICFALIHLHSLNRYHFDLAPKNIFLRRVNDRPHVLLGDLGVSRFVPSPVDAPNFPIKSVKIFGTREYAPPEIEPYRNREIPVDILAKHAARWDLYALGKVTLKLMEAWGLTENRDLEATRIVCSRIVEGGELTSAAIVYREFDRLLPSHVITANVEELSTDAVGKREYIRIPDQSVPVSERTKALLNHPALTRLQHVPQLLLSRTVTPGGVHSVFEHALGSYALMLRCVTRLLSQSHFRASFAEKQLEEALLSVILSKVDSFPFDRILLSIQPYGEGEKSGIIREIVQRRYGEQGSIADIIRDQFPSADLDAVADVVCLDKASLKKPYQRLISALIRSSLDVRVMDYLVRDSHHTGIPSGAGLDVSDIIENLTWKESYNGLAISRSAVFSVEHLLSARYWMFARLYWNTPNRSITAMLRHVIFEILSQRDVSRKYLARSLMEVDEPGALAVLQQHWRYTGGHARDGTTIVDLLSQSRPQRYRPLLELFSKNWGENREAGFNAMKKCAELSASGLEDLRKEFSAVIGHRHNVDPSWILFDVPREFPLKLGEDIIVEFPPERQEPLTSTSQIISMLPQTFFETAVRLRVFHHPSLDPKLIDKLRHETQEFLDSRFL